MNELSRRVSAIAIGYGRRATGLVLSLAVALLCISAASAADMPVKAQIAAPPAPSWTGFYFGGNIGGGRAHSNVGYTPNDPVLAQQILTFGGALADRLDYDTELLGGLQAGYNYQFDPRWVIGLEADFDWTGIKGSGTRSAFGGAIETSVNQNIEWFGTVRGRLGYLPAPNLLAFVTGGFAYGKIDRNASFAMPVGGIILGNVGGVSINCLGPAVCLSGSSSDVMTGWTIGGGLEYALWQNWTLKAEYLYVNLGSGTVTEKALVFNPGTAPVSFNADIRTNLNIVRVGVNYRF